MVTLVPSEEWLALAPDDPFKESAVLVWGCVYTIDEAYTQCGPSQWLLLGSIASTERLETTWTSGLPLFLNEPIQCGAQ